MDIYHYKDLNFDITFIVIESMLTLEHVTLDATLKRLIMASIITNISDNIKVENTNFTFQIIKSDLNKYEIQFKVNKFPDKLVTDDQGRVDISDYVKGSHVLFDDIDSETINGTIGDDFSLYVHKYIWDRCALSVGALYNNRHFMHGAGLSYLSFNNNEKDDFISKIIDENNIATYSLENLLLEFPSYKKTKVDLKLNLEIIY